MRAKTAIGKNTTALEKIQRYLTENDVQLDADEVKLLARLEFADQLMQQSRPMAYMIHQMKEKFAISQFTAQNDLFRAQQLFGAVRLIDKRYILFHKFKRQEADIERTRKKMAQTGGFEDPKMLAALSKMEEAATYTMNSIPQELRDPLPKSPAFFFTLFNNGSLSMPMQFNEAMEKADAMIKKQLNNE